MRGDHAAARQVQLVSVVNLHAPDRHGRHPPHPHDVPPAGALRIVVQPLLVLRFLAGQAEDFVRGGEVDHVAGRGLLVTSLDSLGGHRTAITEAQHELTDPFGQPLVGHRKLHRASTGNGPVRIQDPRKERTPLGDRGAQILDRDVLVPEQAQRPQLGLEAAVRQPAPAAKPSTWELPHPRLTTSPADRPGDRRGREPGLAPAHAATGTRLVVLGHEGIPADNTRALSHLHASDRKSHAVQEAAFLPDHDQPGGSHRLGDLRIGAREARRIRVAVTGPYA